MSLAFPFCILNIAYLAAGRKIKLNLGCKTLSVFGRNSYKPFNLGMSVFRADPVAAVSPLPILYQVMICFRFCLSPDKTCLQCRRDDLGTSHLAFKAAGTCFITKKEKVLYEAVNRLYE